MNKILEIKDKYHRITITLITYLQNKNSLYLSVYRRNSLGNDVFVHNYVPTIDGSKCTFRIEFSDDWFNVGDVISKILVGITGTYDLYELNEGINVVVDGVETDTELVINNEVKYDSEGYPIKTGYVYNPQFALQFADSEEHRIRAVYKGNKEIGVALSDEIILQPTQRPTTDPDTSPAGKYAVAITKTVSQMKYLEEHTFQFRLTKGGVGVGGRTLQIVLPYGGGSSSAIVSRTTDSQGYVDYTPTENMLSKWTPKKWKIGARFYNYDDDNNGKIVTSAFKYLEVIKNDVKIGFKAAGAKGKQARFTLKNPLWKPMPNTKLTIKVGSKKYVKTTDNNGRVYLSINNKGHFKYTVTYIGDDNYNKQTKKFEETIEG